VLLADKKADFRDIKIGQNLVGRIYRDGRVVIGARAEVKDVSNPIKLEVEVTLNFKDARQFCESVSGMISQFEGRY
jgi:hypothetical protein